MKTVFVLLLAGATLCRPASGQGTSPFGAKQSFGITAGYSPTSEHILIGISEQRRTVTAGVEFTDRLWEGARARLDYSGEFSPLFRESDPTIVALESELSGQTVIAPITPKRSISVSHASLGSVCSGTCAPIYPVYGHDETTYAAAISPVGARAVFLPRRRVQPTFASNAGFVVSSRDIPVDSSAQLNYQFSLGPGVQVFASRESAVRLEYVYRHLSNANTGTINPGIDQGVFRLTLTRYRR